MIKDAGRYALRVGVEARAGMMRDHGSGPDSGLETDRPRRRRRLLIYLLAGIVAAGVGAAVTLVQHDDPASASTHLNQARVEREVEPGIVDIKADLQYDDAVANDTGMVLSADGLVLTSNNDIDGSTSGKATIFGSGRAFTARVLGYDPPQDVALLQLEGATGLPAVTLGNSSQVTTGMPVLALGNAEGALGNAEGALGNAGGEGGVTPATGIISALDTSISSGSLGTGTAEYLQDVERTSAQVGPGDDGGPLVDSGGQVIGMITTANTSAGASTTGFAIPINTAMTIAREISSGQSSSTVYLGVPGFLGVQVSTTASAQPGARVVGVLDSTPASRAGLAAGDVITGINGHPVTTPDSLNVLLQRYHPGDAVSVTWTSLHGAAHTAHITLGSGTVG